MSQPITILIGPDSVDPDRPKFQGSQAMFKLAEKDGPRKTVFSMIPNKEYYKNKKLNNELKGQFSHVPGGKYKGSWLNNKKDGFGTQTYTSGAVYSGEWSKGKRHGKGTYYTKTPKGLSQTYAGDWLGGQRSGIGVSTTAKGRYEGGFEADVRSGHGKMTYADGSVYEGEWKGGGREGMGVLSLPNDDKYVGMFRDDMKDGPGRFEYASTGKVYAGEWRDDSPVCGEFMPNPKGAGDGRETFNLPELSLVDPQKVLGRAVAEARQEKAETMRPGTAKFGEADMAEIRAGFEAAAGSEDTVLVKDLEAAISSLGINLASGVLDTVLEKIGAEEDDDISYPEFVDIVVVCASGI
mmetsp:Transcript_3595/g.6811  ORF Transcript_3595/g.6811 Transcript_3595/m.6811 type:complete len:352 (-) Transcript_3595:62-1117(-)